MIHAICHIEFTAINLALDAAWRFRHLPDDFLADWLRVAADEARHFGLLSAPICRRWATRTAIFRRTPACGTWRDVRQVMR
jgi:hypothetical protein